MTDTPPPVLDVPDLSRMGVDAGKPLVIVDVDEVLGLFMQGFGTFLAGHGLEFRVEKFALFQNIYRPGEAEHLDIAEGRKHYDEFFREACGEMPLAPGGPEALRALSAKAGVVILTNAPGQARQARARWLARHGMDYPLILNTGPKGPLASALARQVTGKVAFIDDLIPNLDSVQEHAPHITRFQSVADPRLRPLAPAKPHLHTRIDDWAELRLAIAEAIA
ncbi:MAG TPA: hypothetical protein VFW47_17380 [Phenylobacterium sp.]|nr:hypothetical protein [Phenylobacterium sp.]